MYSEFCGLRVKTVFKDGNRESVETGILEEYSKELNQILIRRIDNKPIVISITAIIKCEVL